MPNKGCGHGPYGLLGGSFPVDCIELALNPCPDDLACYLAAGAQRAFCQLTPLLFHVIVECIQLSAIRPTSRAVTHVASTYVSGAATNMNLLERLAASYLQSEFKKTTPKIASTAVAPKSLPMPVLG